MGRKGKEAEKKEGKEENKVKIKKGKEIKEATDDGVQLNKQKPL